MHHRAWSLCLCFGDRLQLWCLSTCWPNTLTLSAKSGAEERQSKSRREGHSICRQHLSSNTRDYSCSIMYHHPPQWVTTVQQAFKLDREQQLSKHTNRGADSLEAGLRTLKWPLSKRKTVGFNHDSGETGELGDKKTLMQLRQEKNFSEWLPFGPLSCGHHQLFGDRWRGMHTLPISFISTVYSTWRFPPWEEMVFIRFI